jgi:molybdate transport system ATP-binding protein
MTLSVACHKRLADGFTLDVTLAVPAGITMLFGPSGSGKTTLLRCIAGLVRPDAGRIVVGDRVVFDASTSVDLPASDRVVGYVFQSLALFPHLTVEKNIQYGLWRLDERSRLERTRRVLESFRIGHLIHRTPTDISGGERQRVALARSLVTDPELLLLDEPLSALDSVTRSRIMEDLRVWNAGRGIPILYVTHAHREVFALGARVVVLQGGTVLAQGAPQEVLDAPTHEAVAQLAGFENFLDARVIAVRADAGTMQVQLAGTETDLEVPLSNAAPGSIARIAIRAGDILVATEAPRGLSARNVLPGTIESLRRDGVTIVAEVRAGSRFEVHITPGACESLRLRSGQPVWLIIKTHSCRLVAVPTG